MEPSEFGKLAYEKCEIWNSEKTLTFCPLVKRKKSRGQNYVCKILKIFQYKRNNVEKKNTVHS